LREVDLEIAHFRGVMAFAVKFGHLEFRVEACWWALCMRTRVWWEGYSSQARHDSAIAALEAFMERLDRIQYEGLSRTRTTSSDSSDVSKVGISKSLTIVRGAREENPEWLDECSCIIEG
jgi:hypothetical protein